MGRNLKLGTRIVGGFSIVLVLSAVVAYVGYRGISSIAERVSVTHEVNRIVRISEETHRGEMDYMLNPGETIVDAVSTGIGNLKAGAIEIAGKADDEAIRAVMDRVASAADAHKTAFGEYVDLDRKLRDAETGMLEYTKELITTARTIADRQGELLGDIRRNTAAQVRTKVSESEDAGRIIEQVLNARMSEKDYRLTMDDTMVESIKKALSTVATISTEMKERSSDETAGQLLVRAERYTKALEEYVADMSVSAQERMAEEAEGLILGARSIRDNKRTELSTLMEDSDAQVAEKIATADRATGLIQKAMAVRVRERDFLLRRDVEEVAGIEEILARIVKIASGMKERFHAEEDAALADRVIRAADEYRAALGVVVSLQAEQRISLQAMEAGARRVSGAAEEALAGENARMEEEVSTGRSIMAGGALAAILAGILISLLITRAITGPVRRIIAGLDEGSSEVGAASRQMASASESLAVGASQQAASAEETSSSLEEVASMTRKTADHARQAHRLMEETSQDVSSAVGSMTELTSAMEEISRASAETSQIIKTIDEIAFQTNLLALNAAVEAARAGQSGAGFAVVADEVRNLAMRSAEAARNTASLIEGTVKRIAEGSELVRVTDERFGTVSDRTGTVGDLVSQIAAASGEQAQGIEQVNTAVAEMEEVIQKNAAQAEESAGASNQMQLQAVHMAGFVRELVHLVGGHSKGSDSTHATEE